jgi:hypothetical protein
MEKVLEKLGATESITLALKREEGGKIRITSLLWPEPKVILKDEVLEIRNVDGRLHIARKVKNHDEWDPPVVPYDPYGPDNGLDVVDDDVAPGIDVV